MRAQEPDAAGDTATNKVKHVTYVGRAPHAAFWTRDVACRHMWSVAVPRTWPALWQSRTRGQFLLKDLVLLAASVCLLGASVQGPWLDAERSHGGDL